MKKEGFPRRIIVKKESEFGWIIRRAKKTQSQHLMLFRLWGDQPGQRFGIKVGRGFKGAVLRNRLKRAIKETLRKSRHGFSENERVVVICKKSAGDVDVSQVREELERLIFPENRKIADESFERK